MPHLSELHGAATHVAVVAVPVYLIVLLCRRADLGGAALAQVEPWVVGSAVVGTLGAGVTGLLVWGQAQTALRGTSFRIGTIHFWLGIALTYHQGVGVDSGGQFAQTATGAARLELALADGTTKPAAAGGEAFLENALGCASCHGDRAQGLRGPRLAGGVGLDDLPPRALAWPVPAVGGDRQGLRGHRRVVEDARSSARARRLTIRWHG